MQRGPGEVDWAGGVGRGEWVGPSSHMSGAMARPVGDAILSPVLAHRHALSGSSRSPRDLMTCIALF